MMNLEQVFVRIRLHNLKMNPIKCAFGVSARNSYGFLVHHQGIEVNKNKANAVLEAIPPQNKNELQSLIGNINFFKKIHCQFC